MNISLKKDYYVSLFLKNINHLSNDDITVVFKGGTSLSKGYQIIDRFSEDIDLTIKTENNKVTVGQRKKLKDTIIKTIDEVGYILKNPDKVRSRRDHNLYYVKYENVFELEAAILPYILLETIVVYQPYPTEKRPITNYVTKYLREINRLDLIDKYDLKEFEMTVQSIERTFVDKLFAMCDYYLENKVDRFSRHIYDIHMIWQSNLIDKDNIGKFLENVISDRQIYGDRNLSAKANMKPNQLLTEIIEREYYKKDFNKITKKFIHKQVSYEECANSVKAIINQKILPDIIKDYQNTTNN